MNILFLLSSSEPAGSETYGLALARAWGTRHDIFWISDHLHYGQSYLSLPISRKAVPGGLINTWRVAQFVRAHRIQIIHSHSRRARWIAGQVASMTHTPHVATIHQPVPVHFFSTLLPCLGDHTIAIDETVADHLQKHFSRSLKQLSLIRNGIDINQYRPASAAPGSAASSEHRVLFVGRLTGGRRRALQFFFDMLKRSAATLPQTRFQIVGRVPEGREHTFQKELQDINQVIQPSRVESLGFAPDLVPLLQGCRGVIAGGRSAMEALACGKPVIALGERGVVGLCATDAWPQAMRTNFGDHFDSAADRFYPATLEWSLRQLLAGDVNLTELGRWGRQQIEKNYNIESVAREIEKVYECTSRS